MTFERGIADVDLAVSCSVGGRYAAPGAGLGTRRSSSIFFFSFVCCIFFSLRYLRTCIHGLDTMSKLERLAAGLPLPALIMPEVLILSEVRILISASAEARQD